VFVFYLFSDSTKSHSTEQLLIIGGFLGLAALVDILLILTLSLVMGLWITMALLALITSVGFILSYSLLQSRFKEVMNSVERGAFDKEVFSSYFCALVASVFFITPGIINTLFAIVLTMRFASVKIGAELADYMGINWQNTYEQLRLK